MAKKTVMFPNKPAKKITKILPTLVGKSKSQLLGFLEKGENTFGTHRYHDPPY